MFVSNKSGSEIKSVVDCSFDGILIGFVLGSEHISSVNADSVEEITDTAPVIDGTEVIDTIVENEVKHLLPFFILQLLCLENTLVVVLFRRFG